MGISAFLLCMAILCVICASVSAILLTRMLDLRGLTTPFPFIGVFLFRNLGRYREITRSETGSVGPLFYAYAIPINAAWILAVLALLFRG